MISLSIILAYLLLILISVFLDPKRKTVCAKRKYPITYMIAFSTLKMLIAIGVVTLTASLSGVSMRSILGLSKLSFTWQQLGFGIVSAVGFVIIYVLWRSCAARFCARKQSKDGSQNMIELLPKQWLPLVMLFLVISIEAGLLEELFFRGIIQTALVNYVQVSLAVVASGFLFGIAHFYQGFSGMAGTSALGIWLAVTYAITGNLLVPVFGHFLGDFVCMLLGARTIIERKDS